MPQTLKDAYPPWNDARWRIIMRLPRPCPDARTPWRRKFRETSTVRLWIDRPAAGAPEGRDDFAGIPRGLTARRQTVETSAVTTQSPAWRRVLVQSNRPLTNLGAHAYISPNIMFSISPRHPALRCRTDFPPCENAPIHRFTATRSASIPLRAALQQH